MKTELVIDKLRLIRNSSLLIENFSGVWESGAIVALVGNNGAGKSTFLHTLGALLAPHAGEIKLDQKPIAGLHPLERAKKIAMLQQVSPIQPYCIAKNRIAHGLMPHHGFSWLDQTQLSRIDTLADKLNIHHLLHRPLSNMSGGEHRLIDIAKVLINDQARLILLDEPSVFLDFSQKKVLAANILERAADNAIVIFSSHDLDFIASAATEVILFEKSLAIRVICAQFLSSFGARSRRAEIATSGLSPP